MRTLLASITLLSVALGLGAAWAHGGATGIVKERMDAMEAIGKNVKVVGQMLKGELAYDGNKIETAARDIAGHAGDAMTRLFPEGSLMSPTEASPAIWTDWSRFAQFADNLKSSALALQDLAETGADQKAVAAAFGKLSGTCKDCHEAFRIKK